MWKEWSKWGWMYKLKKMKGGNKSVVSSCLTRHKLKELHSLITQTALGVKVGFTLILSKSRVYLY